MMMDKHIELVKKYLADPSGVTKEELKANRDAAAAVYYAAADAADAYDAYAYAYDAYPEYAKRKATWLIKQLTLAPISTEADNKVNE
jgi:hypothetical protein